MIVFVGPAEVGSACSAMKNIPPEVRAEKKISATRPADIGSHPNNLSTVIPVFGAQAKTASTAQSDVSRALPTIVV